MDVTCNRCNTEYEFEEALVSARGTTVKCTHCGHLFKVQRALHVALTGDASHWTVRQLDGQTHTFEDLSELPSLIRAGKLGRDDALSRTGKLWRKLGDIEELEHDFTAADRRGPSRVQKLAERSEPEEPVEELPERPSEPAPAAVRVKGVRHESRTHAWARLLTSAAIASAIAVWFFSLPQSGEKLRRAQTQAPDDPSARFLASAERALAAHRLDRFDHTLVEYNIALAYHEHDPHILSGVSRVHALWAEELSSLSKRESSADTQALEAQAHALQAKRYADLALQDNPGNTEAQLAAADALRLTGDVNGARALLEKVPSSAERLRIAALLALGEGGADSAIALAKQAVADDPSRICSRLLLARLLFARGELEPAREQLAAIQAKDREHPEALSLEAQIAGSSHAPVAQAEPAAKAPTSEEVGNFLERGRDMLEAGQTTGAKRMFEHALSLQPDSVPAHAGLGQVAIARGRHVQAVDHLVAAALAGDADSLFSLADTYRRLGRQREALTAYQSYLQQNPNGPQLDVAKSQIERLGEQFASARKP
jgi:predicted Zn finger-like uncharacterized protein